MTATLSVGALHDALKDRLRLEWGAGLNGAERLIRNSTEEHTPELMVGHLNFIHPHPIQVLGRTELSYLRGLRKNSRVDTIRQLFSEQSALILVADNQPVPQDIRKLADASDTAVFVSRLPSQELIQNLQYFLSNYFAAKITLHGVFMEVMGTGVLVMGESSIGKSELALELLTRGHRLIADDAAEFARTAPDVLNGRCPEMLRDFLEVRGLGIINVRAMFGDNAIRQNRNLRLIIVLQSLTDEVIARIDRLRGSRQMRTILGVDIPEMILPVGPGRNLAVLVEVAVRQHILLAKGYDSGAAFIDRQKRRLESSGT
jgi:HPr kinase/phosphorylase